MTLTCLFGHLEYNIVNPGRSFWEILEKGELHTCYLPLKKKARVSLNTL